jgi:hypothetical protein
MGGTARGLHEMALAAIRYLQALGDWPGAVAAMAAPGLLLAGCGADTVTQPAAAAYLYIAACAEMRARAADKVCPLFLIAAATRSSRFRGDALCKISQSVSAETHHPHLPRVVR